MGCPTSVQLVQRRGCRSWSRTSRSDDNPTTHTQYSCVSSCRLASSSCAAVSRRTASCTRRHPRHQLRPGRSDPINSPQCQKLPAQPSGRHYHGTRDNTGSTIATCHAQNLHRLRRIRQSTGLPPEPLRGVHLPGMPGGRHPAFTAPHRTPCRDVVASQAVAGYPVGRACPAAAVGFLCGCHEGQLFPAGPEHRRNVVGTIAMPRASGRMGSGRAGRGASGLHL